MKDGGFALSNLHNMNCIKGKKGMSALITTVLLVGFVVVMGLVVSNWSTKLIKRNIEKGEERVGSDLQCMNVEIKITPAAGTKVFVQNDNLKELKINGFISKFGVGNKVFVDYHNQDIIIDPFGVAVLDYSVAYDRDGVTPIGGYSGIPESIEVIPRIELDDGKVVDCAKKSAIYTF